MQRWRVIIAMMLLCAPMVATAQRHNFLSRAALDSLVNPTLSAKASGALRATAKSKNIGTISAEEVVKVSFTLRNATSTPVTITELRSSCSCLRVITKPTVVEPNATISVDAEFNPAGRNGSFSQNIILYTSLDTERPTERLTLEGEVRNGDEWLHLPERMGALRLSRKEVTLTTKGYERIIVANTSSQPIRLTAQPSLAGLEFRCEPEILEAGEEGNIALRYIGEARNLTTLLIVEGIAGRPTERMIKITIKQ